MVEGDMDETFTIIKNDFLGKEVWRYPGRLIKRSHKGLLFEAHFNRDDFDFYGMFLKRDDLFLELYLLDSYFNIYQIYDRDSGALKGWYCNITRPIRTKENKVEYDDLALDLLVFPDGNRLVLDVDEFDVLDIDVDLKRKALQGLCELQAMFDGEYGLDVRNIL
jgi:hypothetical protein